MVRILLVISLMLLPALSPAPNAEGQLTNARDTDEILEISVDSKGCSGTCPVYAVTLRCTGSINSPCLATYTGTKWTNRLGRYRGEIAASVFRDLARDVEEQGFFKLSGQYERGKFDAHIVSVGIVTGRRRKTVTTYDMETEPAALRGIQKAVEKVIDGISWEREGVR